MRGNTPEFSQMDDRSDQETMNALFNAFGDVHGSAIMLPSGETIARTYDAQLTHEAVALVTVAENEIDLWWHPSTGSRRGERQPMAFSSHMTRDLTALTATLIGVSGTGSIMGEQLARAGFGRIVAIDFDRIETKNLNRILNSTTADAESNELKVQVFSRAVASHRSDCQVVAIEESVCTRNAVEAAACGDIIFCCVDSYEARMVADRIASAFLIPLIDVGVSIPTHSAPGQPAAITDVCARVDYIHPGGSTLSDRGVYTPERLAAEALMVSDPDSYRDQLEAGYFRGTIEEAPAVISLNMTAASIAFNEFVARTFPFRQECNAPYAQTRFSMADYSLILSEEHDFDRSENPILGRGSQPPLLNLPQLG